MSKLSNAPGTEESAAAIVSLSQSTSYLFTGWLLCTVALAVALLPYTDSGFYSDDTINSTLPGALRVSGLSLWAFISKLNREWLASGRWFPFTIVIDYPLWFVASGHFLNRCVQVSLVVLNIATGVWLLRIITSSRSVPLLFAGVFATLFQVRVYHDPITSFSPLLQVVVLLVLLTAYLFFDFLMTGRRGSYLLSLVCYAVALGSYEISLVILFLVIGMAFLEYRGHRKRCIIGLSGHLLLTAMFLGLSFYLKAHSAAPYSGVQLKLSGHSVAAFFMQLSAAFPLNYLVFDPQRLFHPFAWPGNEGWVLASLVFLGTAGTILVSLRRARLDAADSALALFLGFALLLVPAAMIAVSTRYQKELQWGVGYLAVYMQYFGVAIITAISACWVSGRIGSKGGDLWQTGFAALLGITCGLISATTFLSNRLVVEYQNINLRYPRDFIEGAAKHGLFDGLPRGSVLLRDTLNVWDTPEFYSQHTSRELHVLTYADWLRSEPDSFFANKVLREPMYQLSYASDPRRDGTGWALLARLQSIEFRKKGRQIDILDTVVKDPVCYRHHGSFPNYPTLTAVADGWQGTEASVLTRVHYELPSTAPGRAGPHWSFARIPSGEYQNLTVTSALGSAQAPRPDVYLFRPPEILASNYLKVFQASRSAARLGDVRNLIGVASGCARVDGETILFTEARSSSLELKAENISHGLGVAFYVRPESQQGRHAVIMSNHSANFRGFTLEQDGSQDPNRYGIVLGNGSGWDSLGQVSLPPNEWSLIILSIDPTQVKVKVVGTRDFEASTGKPLAYPDDSGIVYIGNWMFHNRPFNGQVSHIVALDRPVSDAESARVISDFREWTNKR